MDAQLDLQQLSRSTARRVDPTLPAVLNTVSTLPGADTARIIRGVRHDFLDVPLRAEDDALRRPVGAGSCPTASCDHVLSVHESKPSTEGAAPGARPAPDRYRHPGRKTHVPDL